MPKDQQINGLTDPDLAVSPRFAENKAGICALGDTHGTHPCSADVHALTAICGDLLTMSVRHGADTPVGHHCANLRHMFEAYAMAGTRGEEEMQAKLEKSIRRQWSDLVGLTGGL